MKTLFVWERVGELTENYHSSGGTTVIADDLESARELLKGAGVVSCSDVFTDKPDFSAPVLSEEDKVFVFPDAGCC